MLNILFGALAGAAMKNAQSSIVDNFVRNLIVEPEVGSVVYCDLGLGVFEHSGIYIGKGTIIHLTKHGVVERCTPEEFLTGTPALGIYVSCHNGQPVGSLDAANRAIRYADDERWRDYNLVLNNCHMFSVFCVTGSENTATFFKFLEYECQVWMGMNNWRVWDRDAFGRLVRQRERTAEEAKALKKKLEQDLRDDLEKRIQDYMNIGEEKHDALIRHFRTRPFLVIGSSLDPSGHGKSRADEEQRVWQERARELRAELDELEATIVQLVDEKNSISVEVEVVEA